MKLKASRRSTGQALRRSEGFLTDRSLKQRRARRATRRTPRSCTSCRRSRRRVRARRRTFRASREACSRRDPCSSGYSNTRPRSIRCRPCSRRACRRVAAHSARVRRGGSSSRSPCSNRAPSRPSASEPRTMMPSRSPCSMRLPYSQLLPGAPRRPEAPVCRLPPQRRDYSGRLAPRYLTAWQQPLQPRHACRYLQTGKRAQPVLSPRHMVQPGRLVCQECAS